MKKILLAILDGFGIRSDTDRNAIAAANAPTLKRLIAERPFTRLACCGRDVGLPDGQMGNSEVGHLNIGAGRVVYQDISRIDLALEDGSLDKIPNWQALIEDAKRDGTALHLLGLVSDGGVHSSDRHLKGMLERFAKAGLRNVYIHAFMDGRDTPPESGVRFVEEIDSFAKKLGLPGVVTVCGRYYAMDRDKRWERVEKAYRCLVYGEAQPFDSAHAAILDSYAKGVTDEFILPTVMVSNGQTLGRIKKNDTVLFFNFRADRAREISRALAIPGFTEFPVETLDLHYYTLTQYDITFPFPILFEQQAMSNLFGETIANAGLNQLRCAETEKYAHVTYFFNGGVEQPFPNEDRILIQSPKVATYDLLPEMSSVEVTDKVVESIESGKYQVIIINFANCDMVGHTGSLPAATAAVEAVDRGVTRILAACNSNEYTLFVTADHGNAEQMWDYESNCPHTQHTLNDVYFIVANADRELKMIDRGRLADMAPTLLKWIGLSVPEEMTGQSLIIE